MSKFRLIRKNTTFEYVDVEAESSEAAINHIQHEDVKWLPDEDADDNSELVSVTSIGEDIVVEGTRRKKGCESVIVALPDGHFRDSYAALAVARALLNEMMGAGHVEENERILDAKWTGDRQEQEHMLLHFLTMDEEGIAHANVAFPEGG